MIISRHSAAEHRASTKILHRTLFLASLLISAQVFLTPLASSSTALRHVFLGLCPVCLWDSTLELSGYVVGQFPQCMAQPSPLAFPDLQSILGCFVRFHNSLFVIWSGQKILSILLRYLYVSDLSWWKTLENDKDMTITTMQIREDCNVPKVHTTCQRLYTLQITSLKN
jgi:hypothetical protein